MFVFHLPSSRLFHCFLLSILGHLKDFLRAPPFKCRFRSISFFFTLIGITVFFPLNVFTSPFETFSGWFVSDSPSYLQTFLSTFLSPNLSANSQLSRPQKRHSLFCLLFISRILPFALCSLCFSVVFFLWQSQ